MKLLVFSPYYTPHIGGLESYSDEFNKYLSQTGIDITVFTPRLPKEAPENEITPKEVKIIRFPAFEIIHNYPLPKLWKLKFWKLFFKQFETKYDIAISHTRFFNTSLLALFYSKIKKIRWIHIEHGSSFVKSGNKFVLLCANLYDRTLGRLVLSNANDIVAVSQSVFDFIKTLTSNKNMSVIYRGFDIEAIASIKPDEDSKKDREEDLIISFIGRLIAGKGVKDLLKAFSNIENKNVRGFIIGDGPERKNLEKLAGDLKIKDRVKFFGNVPYSKAISILKISDIFVNPSYTEGLPTTVLEAALCQKAIIATNVGGTNEIIKNNESGILIEPKNSELLKSKLEFLINNPLERERFGDNACRYVKNNFSWEKIIQKFIELRDLRTW